MIESIFRERFQPASSGTQTAIDTVVHLRRQFSRDPLRIIAAPPIQRNIPGEVEYNSRNHVYWMDEKTLTHQNKTLFSFGWRRDPKGTMTEILYVDTTGAEKSVSAFAVLIDYVPPNASQVRYITVKNARDTDERPFSPLESAVRIEEATPGSKDYEKYIKYLEKFQKRITIHSIIDDMGENCTLRVPHHPLQFADQIKTALSTGSTEFVLKDRYY